MSSVSYKYSQMCLLKSCYISNLLCSSLIFLPFTCSFFIEPTPKTWIFLVNFMLGGVQKQKGGGGQGLWLGWMQYRLYSRFFGFPNFFWFTEIFGFTEVVWGQGLRWGWMRCRLLKSRICLGFPDIFWISWKFQNFLIYSIFWSSMRTRIVMRMGAM